MKVTPYLVERIQREVVKYLTNFGSDIAGDPKELVEGYEVNATISLAEILEAELYTTALATKIAETVVDICPDCCDRPLFCQCWNDE